MTDFATQLEEIENTLNNIGSGNDVEQSTQMGSVDDRSCPMYIYYIAIAIPVIAGVAMYFGQPSWVMKKVKKKKVCCLSRVGMYTLGVAVLTWAIMYALYHFGYICQ